jgi:hypothetical protein
MKHNGSSLMDRYNIDPVVDLMDACDILDAVISAEGNGVIGIDVLRHDNTSYFAIYFKKDVLCHLTLLDSYARQNGHKTAYFMNDTGDYFIVPKPSSIVVEIVNE